MPTVPIIALLPPPTTEPAPLDNIDGGKEINLLPRAAWSDPFNPLKVRFDPWENSKPSEDEPEHIQIFLGTVEVGKKVWKAPIDANDLFVPIGADKLLQGEHELNYVVTIWSQTSQDSETFTITVDKEAPLLNSSSTLIFPPEVSPPKGITADYLDDPLNDDRVLATLPDYTGKKVGDVITWYWGISDSDFEQVGTLTLAIDDINGALPQLTFTGDMIRDSGDGSRYAHYQIQDRAGNLSLASQRIELLVEVSPIPRDLPFPKVTQASGSGSISKLDPFNAGQGITVEVPASVVLYEGEEVRVSWGVAGKVGYFLGVFSSIPADRKLNVSKEYVPQHMGKSITVKYEVKTVVGRVLTSEALTVDMSMMPRDSMQHGYCDVTQVSASRFPDAGLVVRLLTRWFLIMPGQYVNIYGRGVSATPGLADITFPIVTDFEITQEWIDEEFIFDLIVKADITPFKVPSEITIITRFSFDGKETWTTEEGSPRSKLQLIT
ncbi:hypothetical protein [Pseudomonas helleri]|uniref:hypothetical protein n=1 Tax=Pseudomonas helleri TaxID=1608996 RepID=UPI00381AD3DE